MSEQPVALTRTQAQNAVLDVGWRYLLGRLCRSVPVGSLGHACAVAAAATAACGEQADDHLGLDLRPDRVELSLQTRDVRRVTPRDVDLAHRIAAALEDVRDPSLPDGVPGGPQLLELAVDTANADVIRPFWVAVLAGEDRDGEVVDPAGRLPTVWFQAMDVPRPDRNRLHLDITVAHDEGPARVESALAAGRRLLNDAFAPSFWVLADADGNEVCVCTWLARDERDAARAAQTGP